MDRCTAFGLLSEVHQRALLLSSAGLGADLIAERMSLEPTAVRPLIEIAAAKFEALRAIDAPGLLE